MFTTVRITVTRGTETGFGTGFYFAVEVDDLGAMMFVVTNKHVVEGADSVTLHCIAANPDDTPALGVEIPVPLDDSTPFVFHGDPDVDIAVCSIWAPIMNAEAHGGRKVFIRPLDPSLCATAETLEAFEPIEPVTFIGYPDGLYDSTSLLPIVRRGHSASALNVDYEGKPTFLIDASVFPGSSGSPVFLVVPASAPDKFGNITFGPGTRVLFLGVVAAVYERAVDLVTVASSRSLSLETLDIGIVYKARVVKEICEAVANRIAPVRPPRPSGPVT